MIRRFVVVATLLILVGLDRLTKLIMIVRSAKSGPSLFPGVFELVDHRNFGILANLPLPLPAIIVVTGVVMVMIGVAMYRADRRKEAREITALTLVLAGAVGNLWDRIQWGFVFDWMLLFGRSAINIADICIAIGLFWYLAERNVDARHEGPPTAWAPDRDG